MLFALLSALLSSAIACQGSVVAPGSRELLIFVEELDPALAPCEIGLLSKEYVLNKPLTISHNVTIKSPAGIAVLRAVPSPPPWNRHRVVRVTYGSFVQLEGVNITGGESETFAGGVWNEGNLNLTNSSVSGNIANGDNGGGIRNDGTMTLTNSPVSGNVALRNGGGIYNHNGTMMITNSPVSGNKAFNYADGGGISNDGGTMTLTNSPVSDNSASSGVGGGIYNHNGGTMMIINSPVSGNKATDSFSDGGGIYNGKGELWLRNSTVSGNYADVLDYDVHVVACSSSGKVEGKASSTATALEKSNAGLKKSNASLEKRLSQLEKSLAEMEKSKARLEALLARFGVLSLTTNLAKYIES